VRGGAEAAEGEQVGWWAEATQLERVAVVHAEGGVGGVGAGNARRRRGEHDRLGMSEWGRSAEVVASDGKDCGRYREGILCKRCSCVCRMSIARRPQECAQWVRACQVFCAFRRPICGVMSRPAGRR